MKLKLKLILASMFFCSLIFAQGKVSIDQLKKDRVRTVEIKKSNEKVTTKMLSIEDQQTKALQVTPPSNRSILAKESNTVPTDQKISTTTNADNEDQIKTHTLVPLFDRSIVQKVSSETPSAKKHQQIYTDYKSVLDQMKINNIERYQAFIIDLNTMELSELKSHYNLK